MKRDVHGKGGQSFLKARKGLKSKYPSNEGWIGKKPQAERRSRGESLQKRPRACPCRQKCPGGKDPVRKDARASNNVAPCSEKNAAEGIQHPARY